MDRRRSPQYAASNGGNEIKARSTRRRGNAVVPLASPPGSLQQSHACPHELSALSGKSMPLDWRVCIRGRSFLLHDNPTERAARDDQPRTVPGAAQQWGV